MSGDSERTARFAAVRRGLRGFRTRLTLLFVAILALVLAGFSGFIYSRQVQVVHDEIASSLAAQSTQLGVYYGALLRASVEEGEGHPAPIPLQDLPLLPEHDILALVSLDGSAELQQGQVQPAVLTNLLKTWTDSSSVATPLAFTMPERTVLGDANGGKYLFQVSPVEVEGRLRGYILLAAPLDPAGQLPRLALSLALTSLVILLLAFGGGYWLADRAMKPVGAIVHTARRIGESDLSRRLNLHREDELGELADTFDQMLDRLQAAFERQRQFTADASHELRSPLAIIELEANRALERTRTPQEYEKVLRLIQSENEWMSCLVNELLLLARLDAGQAALRAERLDLSEVVVEVTERLNGLAQARGVSLKTGALSECFVMADRVYLAQLLTNLVENAIKYTRREDARVSVDTANNTKDGQRWGLIRVADNGPGIPEADLPHIFDRFYRLDKARNRPEEEANTQVSGSGLGLAIASSIAQAYGGKIEVESRVGEGTAFTVWLPAA